MVRKILLVEDDSITRATISQYLRGEGYSVAEAPDGAQASQLIGSRDFDLVISDFLVPHVDGLKLISRIQSRSPRTPVIFISGYLTTDTGNLMLREVAMAKFLKKPFDLENLAATVRTLLRN